MRSSDCNGRRNGVLSRVHELTQPFPIPPLEQARDEQLVDAKGLMLQRHSILQLEDTVEKMVGQIALLETGIAQADDRAADAARRASDERRDRLLVAIGVAQANWGFRSLPASAFAAFGALNSGTSNPLACRWPTNLS